MIRILKKFIIQLSLKDKISLLVSSVSVITFVVLISLFASVYYYLGIESIFSKKVKEGFDRAINISNLYINESANNIKEDMLRLGNELNRVYFKIGDKKELLSIFLDQQTNRLLLSNATLFQKNVGIIAQTSFSFSWMFENQPFFYFLEDLEKGEIMVKILEDSSKVIAVMRLDNTYENVSKRNVYLIISRYLDSEIIQQLVDTKQSVDYYNNLKFTIEKMKMRIIYIFLGISTFIFIISIFISRRFSLLISRPINKLVDVTSEIGKGGNYNTRVAEISSSDETAILVKAFNEMMKKISEQHSKIIQTKFELEERNNFIEHILSELSSGVIAINSLGNIILYNNAAINLLCLKNSINGKKYYNVFPEIKFLLDSIYNNEDIDVDLISKENNFSLNEHLNIREDEENFVTHLEAKIVTKNKRSFFVRCGIIYDSVNNSSNSSYDFVMRRKLNKVVVAFDDITELVSAQKFSAWADIARRIAHEIKNPLTPIQLVVERLEKKFAPYIESKDIDKFRDYLNIILKRVLDMRRMIDDFVSFAKLSTPIIQDCNVIDLIKDVIELQKNQYEKINFIFEIDGILNENNLSSCIIRCDQMQIRQMITNLVKNSAEAIYQHNIKSGTIKVFVNTKAFFESEYESKEKIEIVVQDNGGGIDNDMIGNICEPYVTTKSSGSGLGLSIVKKIVEEHKGKIVINNTIDHGGLIVRVILDRILP